MGGANYLSYSKVLLHTANTRSAHLHISSVVLIKRRILEHKFYVHPIKQLHCSAKTFGMQQICDGIYYLRTDNP